MQALRLNGSLHAAALELMACLQPSTLMLRWACLSFGNLLLSSGVCDTALADVGERRPLPLLA
jgi:hypothetical protein